MLAKKVDYMVLFSMRLPIMPVAFIPRVVHRFRDSFRCQQGVETV